jgi:branched-chain amino acid transport system permease protein
MAVLPLLNISIPGILPGATYTPGSLALLSLCMVFAALALSYNLLLGTSGMLSFGHALYFGVGAYGLGLALKFFGVPLWPGRSSRSSAVSPSPRSPARSRCGCPASRSRW